MGEISFYNSWNQPLFGQTQKDAMPRGISPVCPLHIPENKFIHP